jgi:hypothetical protein
MTFMSITTDLILFFGSVSAGMGLGITARCFAVTTIPDVLRLHLNPSK